MFYCSAALSIKHLYQWRRNLIINEIITSRKPSCDHQVLNRKITYFRHLRAEFANTSVLNDACIFDATSYLLGTVLNLSELYMRHLSLLSKSITFKPVTPPSTLPIMKRYKRERVSQLLRSLNGKPSIFND